MLRGIGRKYIEMQEERLERSKNGEAGFTLIELLVVVIIIGILAAIAIPTFLGQRQRAYDAQATTTARTAVTAAKTYFVDKQTYTGMDVAKLNAIDNSLPATANGGVYAGTGGVYTITGVSASDFTVTVKHPNGQRTVTGSDAGVAAP